ncbi:hypothetical protein ABH945_006791 [Paraburkholderia sp. GAS333]|uniref:hypothetical protein n=1 Tax=Paraburkholderia sp. GAS333 TaxID=3156279 RepID=UPI003D19D574
MKTIFETSLIGASLLFATYANAGLLKTTSPDVDSVIYAQRVVDQIVASHPGITDVILHVTPPGQTENLAIASYSASERGKASGDDDLGVIRTGKSLVEVQKDGVRIGVLVPLMDNQKNTIGALGIVYAYHRGESEQTFVLQSMGIRNAIARHIKSRDALFAHSGPAISR